MLAPILAASRAGPVCVVRETDYAERSRLDFAFTTSGTATLENALLGVPMVVAYRTNWPTWLIAKAIAKVRHAAMPNILAGRELLPELLQSRCTAGGLAAAALGLLKDGRLATLRAELVALRGRLGGPGASRRAAEILASALDRAGAARSPEPRA
jgi:lipid-A-disaccharide synthase